MNNIYEQRYATFVVNNSTMVKLVKMVYFIFAGAIGSSALGAYLGIPYAGMIAENYWWFAIPWVLYGMFGLTFFSKVPVFNIVSLYGFALVGGAIITPLLTKILAMANGQMLVINAFLMTSVLFGALSLFAVRTGYDFKSYTKPLLIAFLIIIGTSLLNYFIFQSPLLYIIIEAVFLIVISFSVIHSTQHIVSGNIDSPVLGASMIFIDFFNMFTTLLQIFGFFGDD